MRTKKAYETRGKLGNAGFAYLFAHSKIKKNCPKGIWQFDMVTYAARKIPHIFFTCPSCGDINKIYVNPYSLQPGARHIVTCHACRFCYTRLPFNVNGGFPKLRREYNKFMKKAGLGDRHENGIDILYTQFVEIMASSTLSAEGKKGFIKSTRFSLESAGHHDFEALLETVRRR